MPKKTGITPEQRAYKMKRTEEKRRRSICASIIRSKSLNRELLYRCIPTLHPEIERVHLSRHKRPKFIFVVCKNASAIPAVRTALRSYKNEEIGVIFPRKQQNGPREIEAVPESDEDEPKTKTKKGRGRPARPAPVVITRSVIDPTKLVIPNLPEQVTEKMVYEIVPRCSKITMFKTAMRPLLLEFKSPDDAYRAFEIISKTPIEGIKISVKYHRIKQEPAD